MSKKEAGQHKKQGLAAISGLLAQLVPMVVMLVSMRLLRDLIGAQQMGLYNWMSLLIGWLTVLDCTLELPLMNWLVGHIKHHEKADLKSVLGSSLLFYLVVGATGLGLCLTAGSWISTHVLHVPIELSDITTQLIWATGIQFLGLTITMWARAVLYANHRYELGNYSYIATQVLIAIAGIGAAYAFTGLSSYIWVRALITLAFALPYIYWAYVASGFSVSEIHLNSSLFPKIKHELLGGGLNRFSEQVLLKSDQFIIQRLAGLVALSNFSFAGLVLFQAGQVIKKMMEFFMTHANHVVDHDNQVEVHAVFKDSLLTYTNMGALIFGGLAVTGQSLLNLWLGSVGTDAYAYYLPLLLGMFLHFLGIVMGTIWLPAFKKSKLLGVFLFVKGCLMAIATYAAITALGPEKAGLGLTIVGIIDLALVLYIAKLAWPEHLLLLAVQALKPVLLAIVITLPMLLWNPLVNMSNLLRLLSYGSFYSLTWGIVTYKAGLLSPWLHTLTDRVLQRTFKISN